MKKLKCVLLIDDDSTTNFINQLLLEDLDITENIVIHTGIESALVFLKTECKNHKLCPELILLDLHMPAEDGFIFLEKLEKFDFPNRRETKIIIVSNSSRLADMERGKDFGVVDFYKKPLTSEAIFSICNKYFKNISVI